MKLRYVVNRILYALLILFIVISLNFFLPRLIFKDPAEPFFRGIPEDAVVQRDEIRKEYGFDKPVIVQYFIYVWKLIRFDFGSSYQYKEPVFSVMFSKIPWSMILSLTAMVISVTLGIIIGAKAAQKRGGRTDKFLLGSATFTTALPAFWIALVFIMLFGITLGVFPYRGAMSSGYVLELGPGRVAAFWSVFGAGIIAAALLFIFLKKRIFLVLAPLAGLITAVLAAIPFADLLDILNHSILPIIVICIGGIISYGIMVRNSMIAVVNEDYITTAKAKGLDDRSILYGHTLRNALLPMVTSIGMSMAGIFGGSVLIERIFAWPGMGGLLIDAQGNGDFPLAQSIMFFYSLITIISNLITDFIYHWLDPRVKLA